MIALFLFLFLALGFSFLCSILEAALLSMPPSFVRQKEMSGGRTGKLLARVKGDIDQSLAAILTLNTVAHTIGAAGVGSKAVAVFGEAYFGVISAILTLLILVVSEIIPKTLGAQYWRGLAPFTARACRVIVFATYPLVAVSKRITDLLQRDAVGESRVSREELIALAQIGNSDGVLEESESRMIRSLIQFRDVPVNKIMTPRTVMASLPEGLDCAAAASQAEVMSFSRIPVYSEFKERVTGYVLKGEILHNVIRGAGEKQLGDMQRPIRYVSEFDRLSRLFGELLEQQEQIAVVVDEFGAVIGLVTLEDIIETLLGAEIVDESDPETDMRELARKRWRKRRKREERGEKATYPEGAESPNLRSG